MSSGKLHDRIGLSVAVAGSFIVFHHFSSIGATLISGGLWSGWLYLSPDCDLFNTNPIKRWGVLKIIWHPYCQCHGHRPRDWWRLFSKWRYRGHWPFLGSIERVIYALLWLAILTAPGWVAALVLAPESAIAMAQNFDTDVSIAAILLFWVGAEVQAILHILADYLPLVRHDFEKF